MFDKDSGTSLKELFFPLTNKKAIWIIIIIGAFVYFTSLFNGFVGDDASQIVNNPLVHSYKNIPNFFSGSTFYLGTSEQLYGHYYKPILSLYYALVYSIFGPNFSAFHFFQIIFHIVNASLLFLLFTRFFDKSKAFFLSIVFLVHPINSEAVFYISAAQDTLFFLFGIVALLLATKKIINTQILVLVTFFLLFSLLSKETGFLFVATIIIYPLIFKRHYFYHLLTASLIASAIYFFLRINAIKFLSIPGNSPIAKLDLWERLINVPEIIFFYVKTFFFPVNLAISYNWVHREISFSHFFFPLLVVLLFISTIIFFAFLLYKQPTRKYFKESIFFLVWFIIGILLHIQFFPLDATVADRWFYFPIVGLLGMIGLVLSAFKLKLSKTWIIIVVVIILLILSVRTIVRSYDWRDVWTLYSRDITVSKDNYVLESGIADYLLNQGKYNEAKVHAENSVNIYPFFNNYTTLGTIYHRLGDYKKSKEAYLNALKYGDFYITYENLAVLALAYGDPEENIIFVKDALRKYPQNAKLWLSLAILEYKNNQIEDAKTTISTLYRFNKSAIVIHYYDIIINGEPLNEEFK